MVEWDSGRLHNISTDTVSGQFEETLGRTLKSFQFPKDIGKDKNELRMFD
jgi:hypothetical protein